MQLSSESQSLIPPFAGHFSSCSKERRVFLTDALGGANGAAADPNVVRP